MLELAEKIRAQVGANSKIEFRALPTDDPTRRRPDISKAIERLGWTPTVSLDEGLIKTISDFRARIDNEVAA
jgi:UDP-glucuronate decarboxylase